MPRPSPLNDSRLITMAQYILTYHVYAVRVVNAPQLVAIVSCVSCIF